MHKYNINVAEGEEEGEEEDDDGIDGPVCELLLLGSFRFESTRSDAINKSSLADVGRMMGSP